MSDVSSATKYFPRANEGFITTLQSTISASATTVPLNSVAGLTDGTVFVGIIEPGEDNEQTFTGTVDTSGTQITGVVWTTGSDVSHLAGVTVVDYVSSTYVDLISTGVEVEHNQDGTHSDITADSITTSSLTVTGANSADGWNALTAGDFAYLDNQGSKSYRVDVDGDETETFNNGQRVELTPTTARGTQSLDLERGSSQYASKSSPAGITFTDDFTCEAWIKLESYNASDEQVIVSRFSSTGWIFRLSETGQLEIYGGGGANDEWQSYSSVPLGEWVHVAATLDMSGNTANIYMNGVSLAKQQLFSGGTSITQAGDLQIGARTGGTEYFDGKIKDVRVWSDIRTESEIQENMNQELVGNESNLVAYFKLEGDYTDETSNGNDLTASGSPVFATDSPFNAIEYGIITDVSDYEEVTSGKTTLTVFTGTDYNIPDDTFSAVRYSTNYAPQGMSLQKDKWKVGILSSDGTTSLSGSLGNIAGLRLNVPTGSWDIRSAVSIDADRSATAIEITCALSEADGSITAGYEKTIATTGNDSGTGSSGVKETMISEITKEYDSETTIYWLSTGTYSTAKLYTARNNVHEIKATSTYV